MERTQRGANPREIGLEDALQKRMVTLESGNTERAYSYIVGEEFLSFLKERGVEQVSEVDVYDLQDFARQLHAWVKDGDKEFSASTAHSYYAYVRAFMSWCMKHGYHFQNPAIRDSAVSELPKDDGERERQFWTSRERKRFTAYMDAQVDRTLDGETDYDLLPIMRDRAMVYLLAYSGVRGAEVFRDNADEKRNGLRWRDIDLEADRPTFTVLGKTREREETAVFSQAKGPLKRYYEQLDPADGDWPVFPSLHPSTLARSLDVPGEKDRVDEARELGLTLPAMSIQAARNVITKHSKAAGLPVNSDDDHLKLHGARRGLGSDLYEKSAELSQEILRHKSVETTHESYREQQVEKRVAEAEDALDE